MAGWFRQLHALARGPMGHARRGSPPLAALLVMSVIVLTSSLATTLSPAAAAAPARPADFDNDGHTDVAVFRPSTGVWLMHDGAATSFGAAGDIAVPGDYDGSGGTDIAVFRPSTGVWYVQNGPTVAFGATGDVPVPGDYDGNGRADIAVYRPSNGYWFVQGAAALAWGTGGDIPVPGDYDGNGHTDVAVFRPSNGLWFVHGGATLAWGTVGDIPVPGDYDGNGGTDMAVLRPSSGVWYVQGGPTVAWGTMGDVAVVLPEAVRHFVATSTAEAPKLLSATPQGPTEVVLTFSKPLSSAAADPLRYSSSPGLFVRGATLMNGSTQVLLSTGRLYQVGYTVTASGFTDVDGNGIDPGAASASFTGTVVLDDQRPTVTSAGSTGNTTVLVQFSEPMADDALTATRYSVLQENVNPEVGAVAVTAVRFVESDRLTVELTTLSQNEVTYRAKVAGVTSLVGRPLADRVIIGGVLVDPTSAIFAGTPPAGDERVDTDGDGLSDNEEARGWTVLVSLTNGTTTSRQVTSSPTTADTDGDGLNDFQEKSLTTDPRDDDTDDDGLSDSVEFNDIFSDPTLQDSDLDGLSDGLEVTFFRTSAIQPDTDGDQLPDGKEVNLANRNPKVADLPKPALEIGDMRLDLDVRFLENTSTETKQVQEKTATATLAQSDKKEFSNTQSRTIEVGSKIATTIGTELTVGAEASSSPSASVEEKLTTSTTNEQSFSSSFTSSFTETSSRETQRSHQDSLRTQAQIAAGSTLTREVKGARAQVGVILKGDGDIAFNIRNLQISALIQDPQNPARLTPIATLLPDSEPAGGFNLGPLVPQRGPILFSNDQVFPQLVEDLMRNPRGVVFRFANYDIVDELGRNFAFTSQEINDRTARVAIDYGGFDSDNDGLGDSSEIKRVATGIGRVVDTNGNGVIDEGDPTADPPVPPDRRVVFDENGHQVGITLRDGLHAMGLREYDETVTPTASLTQAEIDSSYSVRKYQKPDGEKREIVLRVRRTQVEVGVRNEWLILTPTGIDRTLTLDDVILQPGGSITLGFLQDKDRDAMPALMESLNNCSDIAKDSDGDGLDDRFETLVGWTVRTERGSRDVRSRCSAADTDNDGLTDSAEAPGVLQYDEEGLILFDTNHKPKRQDPGSGDEVDRAIIDPVTNPTSADTDLDGLTDSYELTPRKVLLRSPPNPTGTSTDLLVTSPEHFDSDGDTGSDGVEEAVGGNPRLPDYQNFGDTDGDGLVNAQEDTVYSVTVVPVQPRVKAVNQACDSVCDEQQPLPPRPVRSDKTKADTDGDGLSDPEERTLGLDPTMSDTDADGLSDFEEVRGFTLRNLGIVKTNPLDADTDNDKRSDGEEADRGGKMIVRVVGAAPYQAFSDPTDPDADFDQFVDGDEATWGSDPAKYNTDGDNRSDYSEMTAGRRLLVPDLRVVARFAIIEMTQDGEPGNDAGDFYFDLGVLRPDPANAFVLGLTSRSSDPQSANFRPCANNDDSVCRSGDSVLQIQTGHTLFADPERTADAGGISTTPDQYEQFVVSGSLREFDGAGVDCQVKFPERLFPPEDSGVVEGPDLKPGVHSLALHRQTSCNFGLPHQMELTLKISYTAD